MPHKDPPAMQPRLPHGCIAPHPLQPATFARTHIRQAPVEHNPICPRAGHDGASLGQPRSVGRAPRKPPQGLLHRQRLSGIPALASLAARLLAHPGARVPARNGCIYPRQHTRRFDGEIAAQHHVQRQEGAQAVRAVAEAPAPQAGQCVGRVAGGMGGLHAGDNAQRAHARLVDWGNNLGVFEPKAQLAFALAPAPIACTTSSTSGSGGGGGEGVDGGPAGRIADRMDADLVAGLGPPASEVGELGGLDQQRARGGAVVTVGFQQRSTPRAQRAVGKKLYRVDGEEAVGAGDHGCLGGAKRVSGRALNHGIYA